MVSDWNVTEMDQPAGEVPIQDCSDLQDCSDTETLGIVISQEHKT